METRLFPLWAKSWVLYDNTCFHSSLFLEGFGSCHSHESNLVPSRCLNPAIFLVLFWAFLGFVLMGFFSSCQCFRFQKTLRNHGVMPETGIADSETGRLEATRVEVVSQCCRELGRRQWCVFRKDHHVIISSAVLPYLTYPSYLLPSC